MSSITSEHTFQTDIINQMLEGGWVLGTASKYDRARALYPSDCLAYVQNTQPKAWAKYQEKHPKGAEEAFLSRLVSKLSKASPNGIAKEMRRFGTLGALRNPLRDKSVTFELCQFKPDHSLNPDTLKAYEGNILRVVPEVVYSPYATAEHFKATGTKAKRWRIDLVLFLNGIPIVTLELKSDFKQAVEAAKLQYIKTRLAKDPDTKKPEPLLTFKRGALVHFAVSQAEVHMTTRLAGEDTRFLPFNKGTRSGGAGNDTPEDPTTYPTAYLWQEVLAPDNILQILDRYIHLEIKTVEDFQGKQSRKETLIFPRYHQWDLVRRLIDATRSEGPGRRYLAQHSAGSGKSNSIAWAAHQLATLYTDAGVKVFASVIVVTDRTVLDDQLQNTISQFAQVDGVVGGIKKKHGQGSKSELLAKALEEYQPIIIVTLQTFPHVLRAIEDNISLKERCYAIIADEAHSSQSGRTATEMKKVLLTEGVDPEAEAPSSEDLINATVAARRETPNLSYYAFTATPKAKTLELFGRRPDMTAPRSKRNLPQPFHVYSMRQAIEEGYILDVLRNYTNYTVAYNLAQKVEAADEAVDSKRARLKLGMWVRLHDYNISQKVKVIIEHFKSTVHGLLGGEAKAMIVTSSRKEAVRYKLAVDAYIKAEGYEDLKAMVAFSGEVAFSEDDPNAGGLVGESFTEAKMNPGLKGRTLPQAFETSEYHVMIVANKYQTGFDQPKLCAMYVDKKLGGVECVQTLSRLNRIHPGKKETYVIDFFNEPDAILSAFQTFYQTATLLDVSDPNIIWDIFDKLKSAQIFLWSEVEAFVKAFYGGGKSQALLLNKCRPAVERWQGRYEEAQAAYAEAKALHDHAKSTGDAVFMANSEGKMKEAQKDIDRLDIFKGDLEKITRYYEFMSQIVDYDSAELEKMSLFARHLAPLLRERIPERDPIDLSSVELSHYRLSKVKQQHLKLEKDAEDTGLAPITGLGSGKGKAKEEEWLSQIIRRLNEFFDTEGMSDKDLVNYVYTISDKVRENEVVMEQIANNPREQALKGGFPKAFDDAVMESKAAHFNLMMQVLNNKDTGANVMGLVLDILRMSGVRGFGGRAR